MGLLNLIWKASLIVTSKSFFPESITEKLLHEKFDLHVSPNLKSHAPSPLWPDVGLFYQCKRYLHHANIRIYKPHWPTMVREYSILEKIIFYFERCEDNSNVNAIIFLKKFLDFFTKYYRRQSNIGYGKDGLHRVLFNFRIWNFLTTFVI